jgi:hypothetical protein
MLDLTHKIDAHEYRFQVHVSVDHWIVSDAYYYLTKVPTGERVTLRGGDCGCGRLMNLLACDSPCVDGAEFATIGTSGDTSLQISNASTHLARRHLLPGSMTAAPTWHAW